MADQGNDPGSIKVQLSLLSAQDSQAAQQLAASIGQIAKMFESLKASDFRDSAAKLAQLHTQMVADTQRLQQQAADQSMQQRGGAFRGAVLLNRPVEQIDNDLVRANAEANKERARQEAEKQSARERNRLDETRMTDAERAAEHMRSRFAVPLPSLDEDFDNEETRREPRNKIVALNPNAEGLSIPRFGDFTIQDVIGIGRQKLLDRAMIAQTPEERDRYLGSAATADQISRQLGNVYAARSMYRRINNFASAQGFSPSAMVSSGAELGYRRAEGSGSFGFVNDITGFLGMQGPFSPAGGEGFRQSIDIQKLRMQSGINGQQAAQIVGASAQAGFSGGARQDIANQFMAPLFRQFGVDPQNLIPFTQVLRTGTSTVAELSSTLANLGETARTARVDVNTMAQGLAQAGEAAQQMGGSFMSGVRFGTDFSNTTGLAPDVGNRMLGNSFVQAQLAASSGVPTFAQGALSPALKQAAIQNSLRTMVTAYRGAMPSVHTPIVMDGRVVGQENVSSNDLAIGAAAGQLGITYDEAKAMMNRRGAGNVPNVQAAARSYEASVRSLAAGNRTSASAWLDRQYKMKGFKYRVTSSGEVQTSPEGQDGWKRNDELTGGYRDRMYGPALEAMRHRRGAVDQAELHKMVKGMGVSDSEWKHAMDTNNPATRMSRVQRLISDKAREANADTHIAFTGPAAKFFRALVNQHGGWDQFGGEPTNVAAASSRGPSPLSSAGNSGLGNIDTPMP